METGVDLEIALGGGLIALVSSISLKITASVGLFLLWSSSMGIVSLRVLMAGLFFAHCETSLGALLSEGDGNSWN